MEYMFYACDLFGVAVFAISGALVAGRNSMDIFGVIVVGILTALGGGTMRDTILGNFPVAWIKNDTYIYVACFASIGTVLWVKLFSLIHEKTLLIADAFGLAVFTIIGINVALEHHTPISTALIMGIMTGVAGGVLRDIACNEIPLIFQKEIYATASLIGGAIFIVLQQISSYNWINIIIAMVCVLFIRIAAIQWHLSLPHFRLVNSTSDDK